MSLSTWDGTLSLNDFSLSAHIFAHNWKTNNSASPPWLWVCKKPPFITSSQSQQKEGYLSLENVCLLGSTEDSGHEESGDGEETGLCEKEDGIDNAALVLQSNHHEVHYYDFHIVYSASYGVPVLYFRAYCSDGRPLQLNEIEKGLPACSTKVLLETKWTFITQEEHPYLNRPWFKLHPCGTSEWMKLLFLGDPLLAESRMVIEPYLVSWFSVVGQVVGLRVPIEMVNCHTVTDGYNLDKNVFPEQQLN